jgi:hypothetical protein
VALARAAATATQTAVPLAGWSQHLTELVVGAAVLVAVYALVGIGLGIVRPERFRRSR